MRTSGCRAKHWRCSIGASQSEPPLLLLPMAHASACTSPRSCCIGSKTVSFPGPTNPNAANAAALLPALALQLQHPTRDGSWRDTWRCIAATAGRPHDFPGTTMLKSCCRHAPGAVASGCRHSFCSAARWCVTRAASLSQASLPAKLPNSVCVSTLYRASIHAPPWTGRTTFGRRFSSRRSEDGVMLILARRRGNITRACSVRRPIVRGR
jgi:hypothetical protein